MSARRNPLPLRGLLLALMTVPMFASAQSQPAHDMSAMPGMKMEGPKDVPRPNGKKAKQARKKAQNKVVPSTPAPPMDHSAMPGMDHNTMPGMDHSTMPGMDHSPMPGMDHSPMPGMDHSPMPGMDHSQMPGMGHGQMPGMTGSEPSAMKGTDMDSVMKSMQGGKAPPDSRDADAYAEGLENGHMPGMDMADDATHVHVLLDRVEQFHSNAANGQSVDAQAWIGGDIDKLWLKVDGERDNGRLGATRAEALWNHAIATYWGLQTGVRHDFGGGPSRTWASFGFQGLSPYWFDIQATGYVGESGRTALRFEAEYDLLLTQRLVLQPDVKVSLYGKNDPDREIGAGLSDIDAGLRLRYEFSRKFAPYIGVVWNRKFANTARFAREAGNPVQETRVVAGLRIWF